jgi:hypothetical protein
MDFSKYKKLEKQLETNSFELNFSTLDKILYWFSFLGNIAIIYFSYYFFADVVNSIPDLAGIKATIFLIFAVLIMIGYELFKRFAFEQFITDLFKHKKATAGLIGGALAVIMLTIGSFYLSLNGSHRWIDRSTQIATTVDQTISVKADSIAEYYDKEINFYRNQPARTRVDRKYRDSIVAVLQTTKDQKLATVENKTGLTIQTQINKNEENNKLLVFLTFFLEIIVLIGVGFRGYYTLGAYTETKDLFGTPKYKQLEESLTLLSIIFVKGKKKKNDILMNATKLKSAVSTQKLNVTQKALKDFYNLLDELEITKAETRRIRIYNTDYETAKKLIQQAFID